MSTPSIVSGRRMLRTADWLFDRELEAQDNAACAEYDRREAIEKAVTFAELLDECCEFGEPRREAFMQAVARGENRDLHLIHCLLLQAKEDIVRRRLAGGV